MKGSLKAILIFSISVFITGCKLAVIVVEGGEVQSIGSGTCVAGSICIVEVTDLSFAEMFEAVPKPGWYFEKWNNGNKLVCGGSYDPVCDLTYFQSGLGPKEIEAAEKLIASPEIFYLLPVFKKGVRFVEIAESEWLQPFDFRDYSYDQIAAVCSNDNGLCSGSLPDSSIDLTGYYWASISDIEELFIAYGGEPPFTEPDGDWRVVSEQICRDFLLTISNPGREQGIGGHLRGSQNDPGIHYSALVFCQNGSGAFVDVSSGAGDASPYKGAWFWRPVG